MKNRKLPFYILSFCALPLVTALLSAEPPEGAPDTAPVLLAAANAPSRTTGAKTSTDREFHPMASLGMRPFVSANLGILGGNTELKTGLMGGGEFGLMGDYFVTSIQIEHYDRKNMGVLLMPGSVSLTPIMFNFYGKMPLVKEGDTDKVSFRMGGGFDYIFVSHSIDNPQVGATHISEDIDNGVGFHVGGGFDYWVFKNVTVSEDLYYFFFQPDVTTTLTTPTSVTKTVAPIRLDSVIALFKVAYHF